MSFACLYLSNKYERHSLTQCSSPWEANS